MKRIKLILIVWVLLSSLYGFSQVGIGTTTPNQSSILDLSSSSKGLLVPRMTTSQRLAIANPAEGLLVYDLTESTYLYFHGGSWHKLLGSSAAMEFRIGDSVNYTQFYSDGSMEFFGSATGFKDQTGPLESAKPGANAPFWGKFRNNGAGSPGVYAWMFSKGHGTGDNGIDHDNDLVITIEMPHDWKEGSAIFPHVHWSPVSWLNGRVRWGIEYTWVNEDGTFSPTTFSYASSEPGPIAPYKNMVTCFDSIVPSRDQNKISSILLVRLFRNSCNSRDTYQDKVAAFSFDIHYEVNSIGSRTKDIK